MDCPRNLTPMPKTFLRVIGTERQRTKTELKCKSQAYAFQKCMVKYNHSKDFTEKCRFYFNDWQRCADRVVDDETGLSK